MTRILLTFVFILVANLTFSQVDNFFIQTDDFLSKHIENGLVNYKKIAEQPEDLAALVGQIANYNLAGKIQNEQVAFYINAYNLLVIHSIIGSYPIQSPNDIKGFFTVQRHRVARVSMTLNELEKELFNKYPNAEYHFVLVCGAKGCPPIIPEAYTPDKLSAQLQRQTRLALNNNDFTQVDAAKTSVKLSQIFNWYKADFNKEGGWRDFINRYKTVPIPDHYKASYYDYDWSINDVSSPVLGQKINNSGRTLQTFTAGTLLRNGQIEAKVFNNLYTQTQFFNDQRQRQDQGTRSNFFASIWSVMYGLQPNLNVGIEAYVRSTSNRVPNSSPLDVLRFQNSPEARSALTQIGPKIKYAPFRVKGLSVQTTLLFPLVTDLQGRTDIEDLNNNRPYLDHDGYQLFQQFFYDKLIGTSFNLFAEATAFVRIDRRFDKNNTGITTPLKGFLSYFPTPKITTYAMTEFAPNWNGSFYAQSGLGAKYQLTKNFEAELLYTNFWLGRNGGAGQTFNLGMRYLY